MSDPFVSVSYDDADVLQRLTQLQQKTGDIRPALAVIGEEALLQFDEGFEREEDPYGKPWADLSPRTLSWKEQNSRILKKLQSTGRGRASLTYHVEADSVTIGTNVKYMRKHQLGQGVPQRQFLGIGPKLKTAIVNILEDYFLEDSP